MQNGPKKCLLNGWLIVCVCSDDGEEEEEEEEKKMLENAEVS